MDSDQPTIDDQTPAEAAGVDPSAAAEAPAEGPEQGKPNAAKKRKRAGTMTKGKDGKGPARPAGDGRTERPAFDPKEVAEKLDLWRLNEKGGGFMMRSTADGEWMPLTRSEVETELQCMGLPRGDNREPIREVERVLHYTQNNRKVDMVMNIAGHWPGVVKMDTVRVLIRKGPELIEPVEGEFPVLRKLLDGMFRIKIDGPEMPHHFQVFVKSDALSPERTLAIWRRLVNQDAEGGWWLDHSVLVYSWLKLILEVLYRRAGGDDVMRNGHALIIAGKADGGKSLLMGLIKKILGGRRANVEQFLTGKTPFNSDAISAELLSLSDSPLSTKMEDRLILGEFLKETVAESEHRVHPKGRDASYTMAMVRRLVWAHNDDPDNIRQVPPMKPELRDKVIWVRANAVQMPMATEELDDYMAFGGVLHRELAGLVYWVRNTFAIPEELRGSRFGMLGVQDPGLIRELYEDSPSAELLELIDNARWEVSGERLNLWAYVNSRIDVVKFGEIDKTGFVWTGGHLELKALLTDPGCSVCAEAIALAKVAGGRFDRLLGRLKKEEPLRIDHYRTKIARLWRIAVPPA